MGGSLNSREWAIVTLIALIAVCALAVPAVRKQAPQLLRQLISPAIAVALLALACWIALWIAGASHIGLWNSGLLKDTVIWYLASALATIFAALNAARVDGYLKRAAMQAIGAAAFLQYAMNLYTFNFFVELLLQIALLVFGTTLVVADRDPKFQPARYLVRAANTLLVLLVLVFTVRGLTRTWHNLDAHQTALGLAFSIWLPLVVLPFVWTLAILMSYQTVLRQLRSPVFGLNAPRRTQVALIAALGADLRSVNDLPMSPADMRAVATAGTWRGVREAVRVYRRRRERRRAEAGIAAQRLARFAGVKGVDTEGRQRDQREIAETKAALTWLATCHMGHYRSRGAYRTDLLQILGDFDRQGLPKNHGIEMVVASNGASWYAWRRTPSGLILGVGAAGAPPDQWFFAATDPPAASPSRDQRWEQWASSSPDWHG